MEQKVESITINTISLNYLINTVIIRKSTSFESTFELNVRVFYADTGNNKLIPKNIFKINLKSNYTCINILSGWCVCEFDDT
jgi:hypothetical protein